MEQQFKIASLDEAQVAKVRDLEQALGKHMMAYERGLAFASLSDAALDKVQALEKELGVVLLVYDE